MKTSRLDSVSIIDKLVLTIKKMRHSGILGNDFSVKNISAVHMVCRHANVGEGPAVYPPLLGYRKLLIQRTHHTRTRTQMHTC